MVNARTGTSRKKVLIVDDSAPVRVEVASALRAAGYTVVEAEDGLDGLQRVAEHPDLDALVLDINMPRMNGLELLDRLKAQDVPFPILMLTTEGQPQNIMRAKRAGAKGWLVKPIKSAMLVATIDKFVA